MNLVLKKAFFNRLELKRVTNALRLFNSKGDGVQGLIIDQYADAAIIYLYDQKLSEQIPIIISALEKHHPFQTIVVKERWRSASAKPEDIGIRILKGTQTTWQVYEHGANFLVDVNDGLNSGLFLDMRCNRQWVSKHVKGKRVLNCFAYTCAFGLHARQGQAKEVVNVDLSQAYLDRGKRNYQLNGLDPCRGEFLRFDAVAFLEKAVKKENLFDVIIIDPPSFARDRGRTFQIKRDLGKIMSLGIRALAPRGCLLFSTNCSDITYKDLEEHLRQELDGLRIKKCQHLKQDLDFPGSNTFKESYLVGLWVEMSDRH